MALSLACSCGARFEVEETFAGQSVSCPDCYQSIQAPKLQRKQLRTSGFAVASVVMALVLAFTLFGTLLAVLLGVIALAHIKRHRDEVTGSGYAIFGIAGGTVFTILVVVAIVQTELFGFDAIRGGLMGGQVDRTGPMEIVRTEDGFAITRPSNKWGVAKGQLAKEIAPDRELVLANLGRDAYIDVSRELLLGRALEEYRDQVLDTYKEDKTTSKGHPGLQLNGLKIRESKALPGEKDCESLEVLLEVNVGIQPIIFLLRIIRPPGSEHVYVIRGWAPKRKFRLVEPEVRMAMESFRILKP